MGGHFDLRFVGKRWERGPFDTEASSYGSEPVEELHRQTASTSRI